MKKLLACYHLLFSTFLSLIYCKTVGGTYKLVLIIIITRTDGKWMSLSTVTSGRVCMHLIFSFEEVVVRTVLMLWWMNLWWLDEIDRWSKARTTLILSHIFETCMLSYSHLFGKIGWIEQRNWKPTQALYGKIKEMS